MRVWVIVSQYDLVNDECLCLPPLWPPLSSCHLYEIVKGAPRHTASDAGPVVNCDASNVASGDTRARRDVRYIFWQPPDNLLE